MSTTSMPNPTLPTGATHERRSIKSEKNDAKREALALMNKLLGSAVHESGAQYSEAPSNILDNNTEMGSFRTGEDRAKKFLGITYFDQDWFNRDLANNSIAAGARRLGAGMRAALDFHNYQSSVTRSEKDMREKSILNLQMLDYKVYNAMSKLLDQMFDVNGDPVISDEINQMKQQLLDMVVDYLQNSTRLDVEEKQSIYVYLLQVLNQGNAQVDLYLDQMRGYSSKFQDAQSLKNFDDSRHRIKTTLKTLGLASLSKAMAVALAPTGAGFLGAVGITSGLETIGQSEIKVAMEKSTIKEESAKINAALNKELAHFFIKDQELENHPERKVHPDQINSEKAPVPHYDELDSQLDGLENAFVESAGLGDLDKLEEAKQNFLEGANAQIKIAYYIINNYNEIQKRLTEGAVLSPASFSRYNKLQMKVHQVMDRLQTLGLVHNPFDLADFKLVEDVKLVTGTLQFSYGENIQTGTSVESQVFRSNAIRKISEAERENLALLADEKIRSVRKQAYDITTNGWKIWKSNFVKRFGLNAISSSMALVANGVRAMRTAESLQGTQWIGVTQDPRGQMWMQLKNYTQDAATKAFANSTGLGSGHGMMGLGPVGDWVSNFAGWGYGELGTLWNKVTAGENFKKQWYANSGHSEAVGKVFPNDGTEVKFGTGERQFMRQYNFGGNYGGAMNVPAAVGGVATVGSALAAVREATKVDQTYVNPHLVMGFQPPKAGQVVESEPEIIDYDYYSDRLRDDLPGMKFRFERSPYAEYGDGAPVHDFTEIGTLRNDDSKIAELVSRLNSDPQLRDKYSKLIQLYAVYTNNTSRSAEEGELIDRLRDEYNYSNFGDESSKYVTPESFINLQKDRISSQIENVVLEESKVGESPFSPEFYKNSPFIKGIESSNEIVIVFNNPIGDTVLSTPIVNSLQEYLKTKGMNKKIVLMGKQSDLLKSVQNLYPGNVEVVSINDAKSYFTGSDSSRRFVINMHREFDDYDTFGFSNDDKINPEKSVFFDWSTWQREEVPVKGVNKKYDNLPSRIMRGMEIILGTKLYPDIQKVDSFLGADPDVESKITELKSKYNIQDGEKVILISPGSSVTPKEYQAEKWGQIIGQTSHQYPNCHFLILDDGDNKRWARYSNIIDISRAKGIKVSAAKESLSTMNSLVTMSDLVITPDTGIGHFASALGKPTVMLMFAGGYPLWSTNTMRPAMHHKALDMYMMNETIYYKAWSDPDSYFVDQDGEKMGASDIPVSRVMYQINKAMELASTQNEIAQEESISPNVFDFANRKLEEVEQILNREAGLVQNPFNRSPEEQRQFAAYIWAKESFADHVRVQGNPSLTDLLMDRVVEKMDDQWSVERLEDLEGSELDREATYEAGEIRRSLGQAVLEVLHEMKDQTYEAPVFQPSSPEPEPTQPDAIQALSAASPRIADFLKLKVTDSAFGLAKRSSFGEVLRGFLQDRNSIPVKDMKYFGGESYMASDLGLRQYTAEDKVNALLDELVDPSTNLARREKLTEGFYKLLTIARIPGLTASAKAALDHYDKLPEAFRSQIDPDLAARVQLGKGNLTLDAKANDGMGRLDRFEGIVKELKTNLEQQQNNFEYQTLASAQNLISADSLKVVHEIPKNTTLPIKFNDQQVIRLSLFKNENNNLTHDVTNAVLYHSGKFWLFRNGSTIYEPMEPRGKIGDEIEFTSSGDIISIKPAIQQPNRKLIVKEGLTD